MKADRPTVAPSVIVLAPCAARKRHAPQIRLADLARADQTMIAAQWLRRVEEACPAVTTAGRLYSGRAFGLAVGASAKIGAKVLVASAGLGLVPADRLVPSYNLSASSGSTSSLRGRILGDVKLEAWWRAVCGGPHSLPVDTPLDAELVLAPLSRAYAEMTAPTLRTAGDRLRLFGLGLDRTLSSDLAPFLMPYDERLNGLGMPGTRTDFAARAMTDFCENILPVTTDLDVQKAMVLRRMASAPAQPARRPGRRVDDDVVRAAIRAGLETGGSCASLLARIRHEDGLACAQHRFAALYHDVRGEAAGPCSR